MSDPFLLGVFWFVGASALIVLFTNGRVRAAAFLIFFSFNNLFYGTFPGVREAIYIYDFAPFAIVLYIAIRGELQTTLQFTLYAFFLLVLWPFFSEMVASIGSDNVDDKWMLWLLRNFELYLYYLIGYFFAVRIGIKSFMLTFCSVWAIYSLCGLLQYAGIMDTDFAQISQLRQWDFISLLVNGTVPVSFLGFNRGASGVISSGIICYAITLLFYSNNSKYENWVYFVTISLSTSLLFVSGSRTGLLAVLLSLLVIVLLNRSKKPQNLIYLVSMGVVGLLVSIYLSSEIVAVLSERIFEFKNSSVGVDSLNFRIDVQVLALSHLTNNIQTFFFGELNGTSYFAKTLRSNLTHPHSEYVSILWDNGIIGLFLYLAFIALVVKQLLLLDRYRNNSCYRGVIALVCSSMITSLSVGGIIVPYNRMMAWSAVMMLIFGMIHREYRYIYSRYLK